MLPACKSVLHNQWTTCWLVGDDTGDIGHRQAGGLPNVCRPVGSRSASNACVGSQGDKDPCVVHQAARTCSPRCFAMHVTLQVALNVAGSCYISVFMSSWFDHRCCRCPARCRLLLNLCVYEQLVWSPLLSLSCALQTFPQSLCLWAAGLFTVAVVVLLVAGSCWLLVFARRFITSGWNDRYWIIPHAGNVYTLDDCYNNHISGRCKSRWNGIPVTNEYSPRSLIALSVVCSTLAL